MTTGAPFLDGLFCGFSYLQVNGAPVQFYKTLNLSSAFTATPNAATGAIDIAIPTPSVAIPISEDGSGTVTVGSSPANGIPTSFQVPNDDGSGMAFVVDNSGAQILCAWPVTIQSGFLKLPEISAGVIGTPSAGFVLFVDTADHKLKAKGSSGTVTILANP